MRWIGMGAVTATALASVLAGCGRSGGPVEASQPALSAAAVKGLAELPPPYRHADLENGELHVHLCLSCHTLVQGGPNMTGPNLYGVFGRRVASKPDYDYSDALKAKAWIWDAAHLDGWLTDPRGYVAGTKMSFYGLRDDKDRLDTIAYLKLATSGAATR